MIIRILSYSLFYQINIIEIAIKIYMNPIRNIFRIFPPVENN